MANNDDKPQCSRCFGKNWIDLGLAGVKTDEKGFAVSQGDAPEHLYQCGGGYARAEKEDMKQGCMRVIRATPEEMTKGGSI